MEKIEVNVVTGEIKTIQMTKEEIDNIPKETEAERWSRIKSFRDDLQEYGGCLVDGKWFHSDTKSKQQQMALVMSGSNMPSGLQWKTMDGSFVTMTQQLAIQVFQSQIIREQSIFAHAEYLRLNIGADVEVGWPSRYGQAQ